MLGQRALYLLRHLLDPSLVDIVLCVPCFVEAGSDSVVEAGLKSYGLMVSAP